MLLLLFVYGSVGNVVLAGVDKVTLTEAAECFAESAQLKGAAAQQGGTGPPLLTGKQRLALCENAPAAMGPIDCAADAVQRVARSDPNTRLKGADVVALCHGATGIGPSKCFVESKALGSLDVRTHLCNGATSAVSDTSVHRYILFNCFSSCCVVGVTHSITLVVCISPLLLILLIKYRSKLKRLFVLTHSPLYVFDCVLMRIDAAVM